MGGAVLVTGGAGYVGSHIVLALAAAGRPAVVLDDLSTGRRALVPPGVPLVVGDIGDAGLVARTVRRHGCGALIHTAAALLVAESVREPARYHRINAAATAILVETALDLGIRDIVLTSTCAVYGEPATVPIAEDAPTLPINPYGRSKLAAEWVVRDLAAVVGARTAILRCFNVAGADAGGRAGEVAAEATHLIHVAAEAALGQRAEVPLWGEDYPTADGTCIRDYVHVSDLAAAHVAALARLEAGGGPLALNCGYGHGFSVREVLAAVARAAGRALPVVPAPRRLGDPAVLVADARAIRATLDWQPRFDDLDTIVGSALDWHRRDLERRPVL